MQYYPQRKNNAITPTEKKIQWYPQRTRDAIVPTENKNAINFHKRNSTEEYECNNFQKGNWMQVFLEENECNYSDNMQ